MGGNIFLVLILFFIPMFHCFLCILCNTNLLLTILVVVTSILRVHFDICILPKYISDAWQLREVGEEEASRWENEPDFDSRFGWIEAIGGRGRLALCTGRMTVH